MEPLFLSNSNRLSVRCWVWNCGFCKLLYTSRKVLTWLPMCRQRLPKSSLSWTSFWARFSMVLSALMLGYVYLRSSNFFLTLSTNNDDSVLQQQINQLIRSIDSYPSDIYIQSSRKIFNNHTIYQNSKCDVVKNITKRAAYQKENQKQLLIAILVNTNNINNRLIERNIKHTLTLCDVIVVSFGSDHPVFDFSQNASEKVTIKHAQPMEDIVKKYIANENYSSIKLASVDYNIHPKPLLYLELLDYVADYASIMIIDDDILLDTLDIPALLNKLDCIEPLLAQTAVKGQPRRYVPYLNYDERFTETDYISSNFVEMQCPIFNSDYFKYFILNYIKPMIGPIVLLGSDNGIDNIWCQVAGHFSARYRGHIDDVCVVFVDLHVFHLDFQTSRLIGNNYSQQLVRGKELVYLFARNHRCHFTFGNISKARLKKFVPEMCK